jgi:hypothetical protein
MGYAVIDKSTFCVGTMLGETRRNVNLAGEVSELKIWKKAMEFAADLSLDTTATTTAASHTGGVSATSGVLSGQFVKRSDHIELPGDPATRCKFGLGQGNCFGSLDFLFSCASNASITMQAEVIAQDDDSDSFYFQTDDDVSKETWLTGVHPSWNWSAVSPPFRAKAGRHTLRLLGREDNIKIRRLKFVANASTCHLLGEGLVWTLDKCEQSVSRSCDDVCGSFGHVCSGKLMRGLSNRHLLVSAVNFVGGACSSVTTDSEGPWTTAAGQCGLSDAVVPSTASSCASSSTCPKQRVCPCEALPMGQESQEEVSPNDVLDSNGLLQVDNRQQ